MKIPSSLTKTITVAFFAAANLSVFETFVYAEVSGAPNPAVVMNSSCSSKVYYDQVRSESNPSLAYSHPELFPQRYLRFMEENANQSIVKGTRSAGVTHPNVILPG